MSQNPFHLAWFLQGSSIQAWNQPWTGNIAEDWMSAEMFLDLARSLDRVAFDYILLEDSIYIGQNWNSQRDMFLKNGMSVPRQEPSVVASLMLAATKHLGVVPTLSTFAYHPYLTARIAGSLDQISGGRAGWNMVTGSSDYAAQNFGLDRLPEHDKRYDMAAEYIEIVTKLWDSWEPGAILADHESGTLIDPNKVHTIDYKGQYFGSRGPLNSGPTPQGRPVIAQAGGSARGRAIAARYADTIVAHPKGIEAMKEYRQEVRTHMQAFGRNPDHCKILYMIYPIIGQTDAEAQAKADERRAWAANNVDRCLAQLGWVTNIDFAGHDLDAPVGELSTNGHQSTLVGFLRKAGKRTLREAIVDFSTGGACFDLVGSPETVASKMAEVMQEVGGDGYLIALPDVSRKSVAEVTDGLVPVLQRRGLARKQYEHTQFRDNLLAF